MPCCVPGLRYFANSAIGIALGLGGQSVLWKNLIKYRLLADAAEGVKAVQWAFWLACLCALIGFLVTYGVKCVMYRDVIRKEAMHPVRVNFFCGPGIALSMLAVSLPPSLGDQTSLLQALWTVIFFYQASASLVIYHRWLYLAGMNETASAPFLLSVVTWFFLCVLGNGADIDNASGMPLRAMCFGVGAFFSLLVYPLVA
eukprot:TRINITY_DN27934_c0_g1_i2.p1 TRINITY_DN27934_c0_g1~~TRINITY_DN27934_c0_g1_i2.p1  ORF type:complete len:213 (+),score=24.20 TRINITY_DN27934_c0_g1_i2:40-639(+)